MVVNKTVQLSRLCFWVAVLAADLVKRVVREEKVRWALRGNVVGDSLVVESGCTSSLCRFCATNWKNGEFRQAVKSRVS